MQAYAELQQAFEHFNRSLFDNMLPECLLTLQREKKTCGYFSAQRFGNHDGQRIDEIALNPAYFAVQGLQEIMQTIVHEMCHLWQHHHGTPGRGRYHNPQWADKMEAIGLMPSSTGKPGGRRTGDHMADYKVIGGRFEAACDELLSNAYKISWYDRFPPPEAMPPVLNGAQSTTVHTGLGSGQISLAQNLPHVRTNLVVPIPDAMGQMPRPSRAKYQCLCNNFLWAKAGLKVQCLECDSTFAEIDPFFNITQETNHGNAVEH